MTTIRRTIVILILLAIGFFIYRGRDPQGADRLLAQVKTIPDSFFGSGNILSRLSSGGQVPLIETGTQTIIKVQSGTLTKLGSKTGSLVSGIVLSPSYFSGFLVWLHAGELLGSSSLSSGNEVSSGNTSLEELIFPTTGGKLTIVPSSLSGQQTSLSTHQTGSVVSSPSPNVVPTPVVSVSSGPVPTLVKAKSSPSLSKPSSSSHLSQQELRETQELLNHLFR